MTKSPAHARARAPLQRSGAPLWALAWMLLFPAALHAQVSTRIAHLSPIEAVAGVPVTISADLIQGETVERAFIVYRPFGQGDYRRTEMDIVGNTASVVLPAKAMVPPFLEYYIVLANRDGRLETHPVSENADPFTNPPENTLRLTVRGHDEADDQVVFLSPDPGSVLDPGEVLVSFSLLRADSLVVRRATEVLIDGADVTSMVVFSDDLGVYAPEILTPGAHRAVVRLYARDGSLYRMATLPFTVRQSGGTGTFTVAPPRSGPKYNGTINFESRHEQVSGTGTWYNRGGYRFTGQAGDWRLLSNVFLTSDEQTDRQPQNRYFIGVESPWVRLGYGDSYPAFPDLILSGKRVRGLTSGVHLGFFNVDLALGKTVRDIEGKLLRSFPADSFNVEFQRDSTAAYDRTGPQTMGKFDYGTYARDLFVIRPSFGSGETWQLGFTWLKSKDDVGSIRYGTRPQENLVVGTDFLTRIDGGRIELTGQGAFSAYNSDISSGSFTDAYIDSVFNENDRSTVKQVRDILGNIITVNDNLRPLSLKKTATLSYDASLALNYFDNTLKFTYLFRGSDYTSFGQTYLRKDVRGFNVLDRLRLVSNQVFLTVGYERLQDNTADTKPATTAYLTYNMAVSYYSRADFPNITVGFSRFDNSNELGRTGPTAFSAVDDQTNRLYLQSSYDFSLGPRHTATLNVSTSAREDNTIRDADVKNTSLGIGVTTRYSIPLQTGVDLGLNFNSLPSGLPGVTRTLDYSTIAFNARYGIVPDVVTLTASLAPTFGDFKRTLIDAGAEWRMLPMMSLLLQFSYYQNDGVPNDNFASLRYRYDL